MSKKPANPPEKAVEKAEEKSLPATGAQADQMPEKALETPIAKVDEFNPSVISDRQGSPPEKVVKKVEETNLSATSAYLVGNCPILLDGVLYQPYDEILLTEAQAARLGKKVAFLPPSSANTNLLSNSAS